jgi:hypothetical protein
LYVHEIGFSTGICTGLKRPLQTGHFRTTGN